jgi:hypothetical protein
MSPWPDGSWQPPNRRVPGSLTGQSMWDLWWKSRTGTGSSPGTSNFSLLMSHQQRAILDLMLLLPEAQTSETWEPSNKLRSFGKSVRIRWRNEKVKWSRYRSGVAQRVGRGIALLFHDRGTRRGSVVSSTLRPHFTTRKDPVPILQEAGWAPGSVWTGGKSRPHRDSIPDHPSHKLRGQQIEKNFHLFILRMVK